MLNTLSISWNRVFINAKLRSLFDFILNIDKEIKFHIDLEYIRMHNKSDNISIRSLMICLFSYMETILFFYIIYDEDKDMEYDQLTELAKWKMIDLVKRFLLSKKNNEYFKKNYDKLGIIKQNDLIKLRNYLTHFYSTTESFWLYIGWYPKQEIEIAKQRNKSFSMISPYDLYYLINWASNTIMLNWNNANKKDGDAFDRKIERVLKIAKNYASVEMDNILRDSKTPF